MGLALAEIPPAWAHALCRSIAGDDAIVVDALATCPLASAQGVLSRYVPSRAEALVGHHLLTVIWRQGGQRRTAELVVKAKPSGHVVRRALDGVYRAIDPRLADAAARVSPSILDASHARELALATLPDTAVRALSPAIHAVWSEPAKDIYAIVMERLVDVRLADTLGDLDAWRDEDIASVLDGIARVHGGTLGMSPVSPLAALAPFAALHGPSFLAYQAELVRYNATASPALFDRERVRLLEGLVASAPARHRLIASRPLALIHGDLSPRNLCLRLDGRPCVYDWELAQVHLPARDLCELLCYVRSPARAWTEPATTRLLDGYRTSLAAAAGRTISVEELRLDLALAIAELCTFKLLVQGVTHQLLRARGYFERLVANAFACLETFGKGVIT